MHKTVCTLTILATLLIGCTAYAANQDVVQLANGDRITGRIRGLERGRLAISNPATGRVEIRWGEVATITSEQRFVFDLRSGKRYYGTVGSSSAGHLELSTDSGPITVDKEDVVRISPIAAGFRQRTTGSVGFGFSLTSPPDVTSNYELNGQLANRTRNYETTVSIDSLFDRNQGSTVQSRNFGDLNVKRLLPQRWFALGLFQVEQDKFLSVDIRFAPGLGLGRTLVQNGQTKLAVYGGFNYNGERFSNPSTTNNSAEAFPGIEWDWFPAGQSANMDLETTATTFISLQRARVRLELDSELRDYVFRRFFWGLEVFESYDSDPGGTRNHSDFGAEINVGWRF